MANQNNVDTRVVEMNFDNKQFERGAKTTLDTLTNLKNSLRFDGVESGFKNISAAAKNIDFSSVSDGFVVVQSSMSAFQSFASGVFENIGRKVSNLGMSIANELLFAQKKAGFAEYELELGSVQTIQASSGKSFDEIYGYLSELNKYSDQTIYSFSDMTASIGKFTNAGVDLDVAVKAIQGISNEAALSGANANEASRAMYNFAQALSSGSVKLMDWKSIELANMGTMDFKQQLIDTAVELGTLVKQGDDYLSAEAAMAGKTDEAFNATMRFNDSLASAWMTSDVLIETLAKYSDETTELGKRSFAAAQDVKSFSQMIDTLKEATGSGWSETFRLIFGEFEDAKKLWTGVSNTLGGVIDSFSELRNHALRYWKQEGGREKTLNSLIRLWKIFSERIAIVGESFTSAFPKIEKLGHVLTGLTTKFQKFTIELKKNLLGNQDSLNSFKTNLDNIFSVFKNIFGTIKNSAIAFFAMFKTGISAIAGEASNLQPLTYYLLKVSEYIYTASEAFKIWILNSERLSLLSTTFKGLYNVFALIVEVVKQIFSALKPVFKQSDLGEPKILVITAKISELIIKLKDFVTETKIVEKTITKIIDIIKNFESLGKGLVTGFSFVKDGDFNKGLTTIKDSFSKFFNTVFSGFKKIKISGKSSEAVGLIVEKFKGFIKILKPIGNKFKDIFSKTFDGLSDATKSSFNGISTVLGSIGNIFVNTISFISNITDSLYPMVSSIFSGVSTVITDIVSFMTGQNGTLKKIFSVIGEGLSNLWLGLTENPLATAGVAVLLEIISVVKDLTSPMASLSGGMDDIVESTTGVLDGIKEAIAPWKKDSSITELFKDVAASLLILSIAIGIIAYAFNKDAKATTAGISAVTGLLIELSAIVKNLAKSFPNSADLAVATGAMTQMGLALLLMSIAISKLAKVGGDGNWPSLLIAIGGMAAILWVMVELVKELALAAATMSYGGKANDKALETITKSLIIMAFAIRLLVGPVTKLGAMDLSSLAKGILGVTALFGLILGFTTIISKLDLKPENFKASTGFIALLAFSVSRLAKSVERFGKMDDEALKRGLLGMTVVISELLVLIFVMGKSLDKISGSALMGAGLAILLVAMALTPMIAAIKSLSGYSIEDLVPALISFTLILAGVTGALLLLSKIGGTGTSLITSAAAILITAIALTGLTKAVLAMEKVKWNKVKEGLLVISVIAAGLVVMSLFSKPLILLAAAFSLFGVAISLIGSGLKKTAKALKTFTKSIITLSDAWPVVSVVFEDLLQVLAQAIPMLAKKIVEGIKVFSEEIIKVAPIIAKAIKTIILSLIDAMWGWIPELIETIIPLFVKLLKMLRDNCDEVFEYLFDIIVMLFTKLSEKVPELIETVGNILFDLLIGAINAISSRVGELAESLFNLIISIIGALSAILDEEHTEKFIESANTLWDNFWAAITKVVTNASNNVKILGQKIIGWVIGGIKSKVTSVGTSIKNTILDAIDSIKDKLGKAKTLGKQIVNGIIAGIKSKAKDLKEEVELFGESVLETLEDYWKIKSPAKTTKEDAMYLMLGLSEGFKKYSHYAVDSVKEAGKGITKEIYSLPDSLPEINGDMSVFPSITPILNLDEVYSKNDEMTKMFSNKMFAVDGTMNELRMADFSTVLSQETNAAVNASLDEETKTLYSSLKQAVEDLNSLLEGVTIVSDEATLQVDANIDGETAATAIAPFADVLMTESRKKAKAKQSQTYPGYVKN